MANTKISALPAAGALAGTEPAPIVQTATTVKATVQAIANLALTAGATGILPVANGGTAIASYAVGDLLYASAGTTLAKLAGVATGNALISGGVTTAPSWGKIGLTAHVSGTLPVANGGTGITNDPTIVSIPFVIDGGGVTITTGLKGYVQVDYACTIQAATLLGDQSGSIVVDVWKCTYANFDPTTVPSATDKITASAPPTITTAKKSTDSTLTGWTTTIAAGDILAFNVNSVTTMTRVTLSLKVKRT
jgi:hypothetical protein